MLGTMPDRERRVDRGAERGRYVVDVTLREIADARRNAGLSKAAVANAVGLSPSQYGRIERGRSPDVSVVTLARTAAVVGLELAMRVHPAGDALRDAGHLALLERLRARCHPSLVANGGRLPSSR
jgi:transcriptional regulator with XRE-family HTH domain